MIFMIDILLSTYNGEQFLNEQIDSIISQTNTAWRLLIRDDGSTDKTHQIIQEYVDKYPDKICWINKDDVRNVGVIHSFELLLEFSTAPYFMFCDQDDVWLPEKIEKTWLLLQQHEQSNELFTPIIVHTDLQVVDVHLKPIHSSFFQMSGFQPERTHANIHYALMFNCVTGCTMMGNSAVKTLVLPIEKMADMHDSWITRQVLLHKGKVITLHQPTMLYRQHGRNAVGALHELSFKIRCKYFYHSYKQYKALLPRKKYLALFLFLYWKIKFAIS
jgi:glycosyltransferase involved in cell wall biosynthesis